MAEVRKVESYRCDRKLVASALPCLGDFHWLEQSAGWFWLSDTIEATPGINPVEVLTQAESSVVPILSEHGGTIGVSEFRSVCLGMGMNRRTFYACLTHSPIISEYARGVFGLIRLGKKPSCRVPATETAS